MYRGGLGRGKEGKGGVTRELEGRVYWRPPGRQETRAEGFRLNSLCLRHCQQHDRLTAWKVHDSLRSTMTLKKSRHQATMRNIRLVFRQHMTSVVQTFKFARLWAELARHVHPCIQRLQALLSLPAQTTLSDSMEGG